jgi:late competence protein required for DNA uptake (superfamily II DNA/RNA helicase)
MRLRLPSKQDIVLGGTVPPPFADLFNHLLPFQYRLSEKEQAYHAAIFGASGSGKSKLLQSIFLQHFAKGHGIGLIDPHADLAKELLPPFPLHRIFPTMQIRIMTDKALLMMERMRAVYSQTPLRRKRKKRIRSNLVNA